MRVWGCAGVGCGCGCVRVWGCAGVGCAGVRCVIQLQVWPLPTIHPGHLQLGGALRAGQPPEGTGSLRGRVQPRAQVLSNLP